MNNKKKQPNAIPPASGCFFGNLSCSLHYLLPLQPLLPAGC
jgi:hypothetical protein